MLKRGGEGVGSCRQTELSCGQTKLLWDNSILYMICIIVLCLGKGLGCKRDEGDERNDLGRDARQGGAIEAITVLNSVANTPIGTPSDP